MVYTCVVPTGPGWLSNVAFLLEEQNRLPAIWTVKHSNPPGIKVSVALLVITESFEMICAEDERKIEGYENAANGLTSDQFSSPSV